MWLDLNDFDDDHMYEEIPSELHYLCCSNYEHIVKTHQNTPVHGQNQVSDEVKFQVVSTFIY